MEENHWKLLRRILYTKAGIVSAAAAFYTGSKMYRVVERVEDSLLYSNLAAEQGFFNDPNGLCIEVKINSRGMREVYLLHAESGARVAIGYDLLPREASDLARGLEARLRQPRQK